VALVGDPIEADTVVGNSTDAVAGLTAAIDAALRSLTLNYTTVEAAEKDSRIARILQAILRQDAPSIGEQGDFRERADIARLLPALRRVLLDDASPLKDRALALEAELLDFDQALKSARVSLVDFSIARSLAPGTVFVLREAALLLVAGPIALWGWINHVIPFQAALAAGGRVRHSAADPAMRTIVAGAAFIMMMYMLQGTAVALLGGPWWGMAYVASLPVAADINLRTRDRLRRALRRARAYLLFRARPRVQADLLERANRLRAEASSLGRASGLVDVG
jgi:hypothetical protein